MSLSIEVPHAPGELVWVSAPGGLEWHYRAEVDFGEED